MFFEFERTPTKKDLKIGRGVPSGSNHNGKWRVFYFQVPYPFVVWYPDKKYTINKLYDWYKLPKVGVQLIVWNNCYWHCADEYVYKIFSKYGLYLDDSEFEKLRLKAYAH